MSETRLAAIEARVTQLETRVAVDAKAVEGIQRGLDKIEGTLMWLTRLIIGAIILAFVGFVISGRTG